MTSKIRLDFGQLQILIANISWTYTAIDRLTTALLTTILPTRDEKKLKLWSTNHRVYAANVYPPKLNTARAV